MLRSRFIKYWLPLLAWMIVILAASSDFMSTERTSRIIGPILQWLKPDISLETIQQIQFFVRKGAHVGEYGILALLFWRAWRSRFENDARGWRTGDAALAVLACAAYATSDEIHQHFVPSRHGSIWDVLLDTAGAALTMVLLWLAGRQRGWWRGIGIRESRDDDC